MGWSSDALSLRKPRVVELPRASDRLSFLYLDYVKIWQDDTGVVAGNDTDEQLRLPIGALTTLLLGPGCSITTPATVSIHRAGCTIVTTSDSGATATTAARSLTDRARWAEAQARLWTDHNARVAAAQQLYAERFPSIDWEVHQRLRTMRGLEGHQFKMLYAKHAAAAGYTNWRRNPASDDLPNQLLNLANAILYGSAAAAIHALALNPALGVIHQGATGALLFDLADNHKPASSLPLAFTCATSRDGDPARTLRRKMRQYLHRNKVLEHHLETLDMIYGPHIHPASDDDTLLDNQQHGAAGHTNHGADS